MAVISIFPNSESYEALSTDIVNNKIVGLDSSEAIGKKVYITDLGITYTILSNYTLKPYTLPISSIASEVSASITRPNDTTAYAIGDVIGLTNLTSNIEFTNVSSDPERQFIIMGASLELDTGSIPSGMGAFRLHLYKRAPTPIGDNIPFNLPLLDRGLYIGWIDIDTPVDLGDTCFIRMNNINLKIKLASDQTSIFGMLQTMSAYTPTASCVKFIKLHIVGV